jgi:hypothetical protein
VGGGRGEELGKIEPVEGACVEQFGMCGGKGVEGAGGLAVLLKSAPHQEHPGLGDGVVILLVRALAGGKAPHRFRHAFGRRREGKPPQIDPRRADVLGVMEIRERGRFKHRQKFVVGKL